MSTVCVDDSGTHQVLGLQLQFVDSDDGVLAVTAVSILEGFPLAGAVSVFEAAAVARSVDIRHEGWDNLKWLCLLNENDPEQTAAAIRVKSLEMKIRVPEASINAALPARASSFLLLLTGQESDERAAVQLDPGRLESSLTYEKNYLAEPGRSFFPLERRDARSVLCDKSLPVLYRASAAENSGSTRTLTRLNRLSGKSGQSPP